MSRIVLDVSISLDGFAAGPNVRDDEPMGDGGERLHEWHSGKGPNGEIDLAIARESAGNVGAAIVGRRTFEIGLRPWGGTPWPGVPTFVVTHRKRDDLVGGNGGTFYFDDLESAARRAKAAAGDKDVWILGPEVSRHLLRAGLIDEVRLHLVPLLMGEGTPLFAGEQAELIPVGEPVAGSVTHLRYQVPKPRL